MGTYGGKLAKRHVDSLEAYKVLTHILNYPVC
jgi:hypothetical protein